MENGLHEIDVYSDTHQCIRGDKPWTARQKRTYPDGDLNAVELVVDRYRQDERAIVLGDLPGNIHNPHLTRMVEHAHAAIILSRDIDGIVEWERFFQGQGIPVVIRALSYLDPGSLIAVLGYDDLYFIGGLKRTLCAGDAQVRRIAETIVVKHLHRVLAPAF